MNDVIGNHHTPHRRGAWQPRLLLPLALGLLLAVGCESDPTTGAWQDFGVTTEAGINSCGNGNTECAGECTNLQKDSKNCGACGTACKAGEMCQSGKCVASCANGQANCSGKCIDTSKDPANCGACGSACKAGEVCSSGKCLANCPPGTSDCSGSCLDTQNDPKNCGACGTTCKAGEACVKGACSSVCPSGFTNCSGVCVKTSSDINNCGACGTACKAGESCISGKCTYICPPGLTLCSGLCINMQSDPDNCGACATPCKSYESCESGKCVHNCPTGLTACNGKCVDLNNDASNCAVCGTACGTGKICLAGKCVINCPPGQSDCSGTCRQLQNDPKNCGTCAKTCNFGEVCDKGVCAPTCLQGHTNCSGSCADLQRDPANCGKCGNACATGTTCVKGACVPVNCDVFTYGLSARPVDIAFFVDQSGSMSQEIAGIKANLNKFSTFISATSLDYHVIMLAQRGTGTYDICVAPPLGGTSCADGPRYKQVSVRVASRNGLSLFQSNISSIESFMREGSLRQIVALTDDYSSVSSANFTTWVTARKGWKDYVFHSIVGTTTGGCTSSVGKQYVELSTKTGGLIQHLCSVNWTTVFNALAKSAIGTAIKQYKPTKTPDVTSIEVYYNNQLKTMGTDWKWNTTNSLVELTGTVPTIGTKIMMCYLVK